MSGIRVTNKVKDGESLLLKELNIVIYLNIMGNTEEGRKLIENGNLKCKLRMMYYTDAIISGLNCADLDEFLITCNALTRDDIGYPIINAIYCIQKRDLKLNYGVGKYGIILSVCNPMYDEEERETELGKSIERRYTDQAATMLQVLKGKR